MRTPHGAYRRARVTPGRARAGEVSRQPVRPLATIMIGALDEAAMSIANAEDPEREKADVRAVVHNLIEGLLAAG